jgi:hypothetical protein
MSDQSKDQLPVKYEAGFLRQLDPQSEIYRRLQASFQSVVDDVCGDEQLTHIQLALIERFVFLEATLQSWEAEIAQNPASHEKLLSRWIQALNCLTGLAGRIGIERAERKNTIDLKTYLAESA